MLAERACRFAWKEMLWLLLAPLATAYPATPSAPDAPAGLTAGRVLLQHQCASFEGLSFPDGARAAPLTRGPCGEGEWAVRDLEAAGRPRLRCARRPCPRGQVPWEGRCLSHADASAALCGGGSVQLDSTGLPCCGGVTGTPMPTTTAAAPVTFPVPAAVAVGLVNCAQADGGGCEKEVRGPTPSNPDLEPED